MLSEKQITGMLFNISDEAYYNLAIQMIKSMAEDYKKAIKRKDYKKAKEYLQEIKTSDYTNFLVSDPQYICDEIEKEFGKCQ